MADNKCRPYISSSCGTESYRRQTHRKRRRKQDLGCMRVWLRLLDPHVPVLVGRRAHLYSRIKSGTLSKTKGPEGKYCAINRGPQNSRVCVSQSVSRLCSDDARSRSTHAIGSAYSHLRKRDGGTERRKQKKEEGDREKGEGVGKVSLINKVRGSAPSIPHRLRLLCRVYILSAAVTQRRNRYEIRVGPNVTSAQDNGHSR